MLELGERKYDNYANEDRFPLTSCCATRVASQAKKRIFLSEHMAPMFARIIVVFSLTELQHLQGASTKDLEELLTLQSDYGQLIVAVGREMRDYHVALKYAGKAVSFAEQTGNQDLLAAALWRRSEA